MEAGEFEGTIGRYRWESEAWWPPEPRPPAGRPERAAGRARRRRLRAARLLRLRHRHPRTSTASPPAGCATRTSTPPRCARRPGPACSPAATTTRSAWAASPTSPRASRATTPASRGRARCCPRCSSPHGYAAYAVGKWHLTPEDEEHLGARRDRWPLGPRVRALLRLLRRRDAPVRAGARPRQPPRRAARAASTTATTSPRTSPTTPSSSSRDLRHVDPDEAVPPLPGHRARATRRTRRRAPWIERYRGRFDAGLGRVARRDARPPAARPGCSPSTRSSRPGPTGCRPGTRCRPTSGASTRATWSASPAFLSHADAQIGRLLDRLAELGELDDTLVVVLSDNGASSEGGPVGSLNDARVVEPGRPAGRGGARAHRRDRRAADPQQLPVGLDRRRQHAVPALEARGPRGRRVRSAHRPLARRHRRAGRGARASTSTPSTCCRPARRHRHRRRPSESHGVAQQPIDGVSFAYDLRRRVGPGAPHTPVLRDVRVPGALPRRAGRRSPTRRSRPTSRRSTTTRGSSTTCAADPSECHDLAAEQPERLAAMIERWWAEAERHQVLPLDNRPFFELVFGRPPSVAPTGALHVLARARRRCPRAWPSTSAAAPHTITAHVTIDPDRRWSRGCWRCRASVLGGWSFHLLGDGRLCYVHNLAGLAALPGRGRLGRLAPGDHTLAFRFTRARGGPARRRRGRRHRHRQPDDLEPLLAHRRRADRRLVTRLRPCRRGLPRPLRLHRHAAPRRHRRGRRPRRSTPSRRPRTPSPPSETWRWRAGLSRPPDARSRSAVAPSAAASSAAMSSFFMPSIARHGPLRARRVGVVQHLLPSRRARPATTGRTCPSASRTGSPRRPR